MKTILYIASISMLLAGCKGTPADGNEAAHKAAAERFLRGVYGCDISVVDELAGDSIVISYPIFKQVYHSYTLRGREAVKKLVTKFCGRWSDPQITIHDAIAEGNNVVLTWGFSARLISADSVYSWGGITLYRFNDAGKIVVETGEEGDPGTIERLAKDSKY